MILLGRVAASHSLFGGRLDVRWVPQVDLIIKGASMVRGRVSCGGRLHLRSFVKMGSCNGPSASCGRARIIRVSHKGIEVVGAVRLVKACYRVLRNVLLSYQGVRRLNITLG
jgi:hypothetical protein